MMSYVIMLLILLIIAWPAYLQRKRRREVRLPHPYRGNLGQKNGGVNQQRSAYHSHTFDGVTTAGKGTSHSSAGNFSTR